MTTDRPPAPPAARVAGVVLAAGESRRFGSAKALASVGGRTLVERAAGLALRAGLSPVVVVVGHDAEALRAVLAGAPVDVVTNPRYRDGQSTSLQAGLDALPGDVEAALFMPVDQPWLTPGILAALLARLDGTARAVVPLAGGQRRPPAVFHRSVFPLLREIEGDVGGRAVFGRLGGDLVEVAFDDEGPFRDVDAPADLETGREQPVAGRRRRRKRC
jgi:molybdenum cofactor cytidylyltransferase